MCVTLKILILDKKTHGLPNLRYYQYQEIHVSLHKDSWHTYKDSTHSCDYSRANGSKSDQFFDVLAYWGP